MRGIVMLAVALVLGTATAAASAALAPAASDATDAKLVAQIRSATARFQNVAAARAAGYVATPACVASPAGTMGIHYVNPRLLADGVTAVARPEVLLYVKAGKRLRLVGVEYSARDADGDLATDDDRPQLGVVPFDGPMEGHGPGEPVHYDLHVWAWAKNPSGLYAPFNPRLRCGR